MENNETERLMENHRTIRSFTEHQITDEQIDHLIEVAQRSASYQYLQSYSMIRIKDPKQRAKMSEIGNHDFSKGNEELVIFIVDQKRNVDLAKRHGASYDHLITIDRFLAGVFDATIAAQSFALAAESEGLGSLIMGSFIDDPEALIEALELPKYTFPLLGVVVGEAKDVPQQKPRLTKELIQMDDTYHQVPDFEAAVDRYDDQVYQYYNTRAGAPRQEKFSSMISRYAQNGNATRDEMLTFIENQGFKLNK